MSKSTGLLIFGESNNGGTKISAVQDGEIIYERCFGTTALLLMEMEKLLLRLGMPTRLQMRWEEESEDK